MNKSLKWRLSVLMAGAALSSGGYLLQAQEGYPAPAKTPQEAGEKFARLLTKTTETAEAGGQTSTYRIGDYALRAPSGMSGPEFSELLALQGSVSRRSFQTLKDGLPLLLKKLDAQMKTPQVSVRVTSGNEQSALVEIEPSTVLKPLSLVVVAEDGGWRVDAIATYAKSNSLEGDALTDALIVATGTIPQGSSPTRLTRTVQRTQCQRNLKQIALGLAQYMQDWDEKLPPARRWTDVLQPYLKSRAIFTCPALPAGKSNGYAYNQNLSQIKLSKVRAPQDTISVYETSNLSPNAFGLGTARAFRHDNGANYAYIDGHVMWTPRDSTTPLKFKP